MNALEVIRIGNKGIKLLKQLLKMRDELEEAHRELDDAIHWLKEQQSK